MRPSEARRPEQRDDAERASNTVSHPGRNSVDATSQAWTIQEPTIAEAVEDLGYELIYEAAGYMESFAISLGEAAVRRDNAEVDLHLRRLFRAVNLAIQTDAEMRGAKP